MRGDARGGALCRRWACLIPLADTGTHGTDPPPPLTSVPTRRRYWLIVASAVPPAIAATLLARRHLLRRAAEPTSGGGPAFLSNSASGSGRAPPIGRAPRFQSFTGGVGGADIKCNATNTLTYPTVCTLAGVIAGMFGLGARRRRR